MSLWLIDKKDVKERCGALGSSFQIPQRIPHVRLDQLSPSHYRTRMNLVRETDGFFARRIDHATR